jgi:hypothetical protein
LDTCYGVSKDDNIHLLIQRDPSLLRILNYRGRTALETALASVRGSVSAETIRLMVHRWPVPCIFTDAAHGRNEQILPYDFGFAPAKPIMRQGTNVVELVAEATNDTFCSLMELKPRGSLPEIVVTHLRETIAAVLPNFEASTSGVVLLERLGPHLTPELVRELVDHNELQELLKIDQDLQSLISGLVRMNKAGRNYFQDNPGDIMKGVHVLESASGNVDSLFLHLRETHRFATD